MPYVLDTNTSKDRPKAASHAANMSRILGTMLASVKWVFKIVIASMINKDNIMPSRHSSEDIRCDAISVFL